MKQQRKQKATAHDALTELEKGTIGAAILDPVKVLSLVSDWGATAEWFESDTGKTIFAVLLKMFVDGDPIDIVTTQERVRLVAGDKAAHAIDEAIDKVPGASYGGYYLDLLRDAWFTRVCRSTASQMSADLADGSVNRKLVVSEAINNLVGLIEHSGKGKQKTPQQLRAEVVAKWEDAEKGIASAFGLPFPFAGVNALTCGIPDGVTVIAARPSVGKTVMEGCISRKLLIDGYRVARVCLDMTIMPFVSRDLCALGIESMNKMRAGFMKTAAREKMKASLEAMKPWREEIISERTSAGIISKLRALLANGGLDLVTIDYIQLVDTVGEEKYSVNDNVRISRAMARFKDFNATTGVPVIILSQLSRGVEKDDRIPQLSDLRDSGSLEQDATLVAFLYPDPEVSKEWCTTAGVETFKQLPVRPIMFDIQKQQNGALGKVATRQFGENFIFEECGGIDNKYSFKRNCSFGYDFKSVRNPSNSADSQNVYSVCKSVTGRTVFFDKHWLEKINAVDDSGTKYTEIKTVTGMQEAIETVDGIKKGIV